MSETNFQKAAEQPSARGDKSPERDPVREKKEGEQAKTIVALLDLGYAIERNFDKREGVAPSYICSREVEGKSGAVHAVSVEIQPGALSDKPIFGATIEVPDFGVKSFNHDYSVHELKGVLQIAEAAAHFETSAERLPSWTDEYREYVKRIEDRMSRIV